MNGAPRFLAAAGALLAIATFATLPGCSTDDGAVPCSQDSECGGHKCVDGTCGAQQAACKTAGARVPGDDKTPACDGEPCKADNACASASCKAGACAPTAGKTCGVGLPTPCNDGDGCQQDADCQADSCDQKCSAPPANVHTDGRRNGGETGADCGGSSGVPCPAGQKCKAATDCISTCNGQGECDVPSATDGKKNQDETDVDCGGATSPKCGLTKACTTNADCQLDACTEKVCVKPTNTDGVKNGGESDVDCGGAGVTEGDVTYKAPRCSEGHVCAVGSDCNPDHGCSGGGSGGVCTMPSCATGETAGIVTCGSGETGEQGAKHESCCRSLSLPSSTNRRLDKYEITSGRMRAFLTAVGPNVRKWVADYVKAHPTSSLATHVTNWPVVADLYPEADRFENLSLTAHMSHDIDNYDGARGCYNGDGDYSANTYWMDATHYADWGLPPRALERTISDEKPLNCAMSIMFDAFCAWDGGELATIADFQEAWGTARYPWGASANMSEYNWCNGDFRNGGFGCQCDGFSTRDPQAADSAVCPAAGFAVNGEPGVFYEYPVGTDRGKDNSPLIAAPGRFTTDATATKSGGESWYDLAGNLAEITGDWGNQAPPAAADFCDLSGEPVPGLPTCTRLDGSVQMTPVGPGTHYTGIPAAGLVGDTWEGHQYGRGAPVVWPVTAQYGKFGARCVRPAE